MRLVASTKEIIVKPKLTADQGSKFSLVFRSPNQMDVSNLAMMRNSEDVVEILNNMFVKFTDKIEVADEEGNLIDYDNFKALMSISCSDLAPILMEVIKTIKDAALSKQKEEEQVKEVEKKS